MLGQEAWGAGLLPRGHPTQGTQFTPEKGVGVHFACLQRAEKGSRNGGAKESGQQADGRSNDMTGVRTQRGLGWE